MSNLLVERNDEISTLLAHAEQHFNNLKQTFAAASTREFAESELRLSINNVQGCLTLAYEALTEQGA